MIGIREVKIGEIEVVGGTIEIEGRETGGGGEEAVREGGGGEEAIVLELEEGRGG